ncbi:hypothetical protein TNCV_2340411 [Trichonephila clavipes]|nr:hypothetical protein TNCV_2340411 [Trichonephila clavipes]
MNVRALSLARFYITHLQSKYLKTPGFEPLTRQENARQKITTVFIRLPISRISSDSPFQEESSYVEHAFSNNVLCSTAEAAYQLQSSTPYTISKLTSSSFEYEFILLPRKTDSKRRLSAGSVFMKPSVQRHLPQNYPEECT